MGGLLSVKKHSIAGITHSIARIKHSVVIITIMVAVNHSPETLISFSRKL
jgi:hypothetical protein